MTVTIGGRLSSSSSLSSSWWMASATSADTYSVWKPNSSATMFIVSASRRWFIDTITPMFMQVAMTLLMGTSIMVARSLAVTNSVSLSTRLSACSISAASRSREAMASRFSLRHFAPFFWPLSLLVRRASVSFTCFCTSSSLTSVCTGRFARGFSFCDFPRFPRSLPPWFAVFPLRPFADVCCAVFSMSIFSLPDMRLRFFRSADVPA